MTFITVFAGGIAIQRTSWPIWFWQLGSCVLAIFFVYFMCPETGNKTLEEVDLVFMDKAQYSAGKDILECIRLGDLPGIGMVVIDGIVRAGRSRNTPPAAKVPEVVAK